MRGYILIVLLCQNVLLHSQHTAQKHMMGHGWATEGCYDGFVMDFSGKDIVISDKPGPRFPNLNCRAHSTICNRYGDLQFSFECSQLLDKNFNPMKGAEQLFSSNSTWTGGNYIQEQGFLAIPIPGFVDEKYYVFYENNLSGYPGSEILKYGIVDMRLENGLGEMIQKYVKFQE